MKSLNTYINETLVCSHSEHITEWKANVETISSIKKKKIITQYFVYKLDKETKIRIFDKDWNQFKDYKDSVYINDKHIEIDDIGCTTEEYKQGIYEIEIKDIDNITNCEYMFWNCTDLVKVPIFDTSKVKYMFKMFYGCERLVSVPLFDTSNVKNMYNMFWDCNSLSEQTKKEWSQIYDFEKDDKKK